MPINKETIISELKRTAALNSGIVLGKAKFFQETGIKESDWYGKYWTKWSDAVKEAGLKPNVFTQAIDEEYLLKKITDLIIEIKCFPTQGHLRLKANNDQTFPDDKVFYNRFGNKSGLIEAVREYGIKQNLDEVLSHCPPVLEEQVDDNVISEEVTLGFVYLYKSKNYYKIGRTNNSSRRNREIKLQLPFETDLIHSISTDDPVGIEKYWHSRFADKRLNGEWFQLSAADIKAFRRRKFM